MSGPGGQGGQGLQGLRDVKREATARALAQAAFDLAVERGLDGFTTDDIVSRAGYSRRTFANHYSCKEEAVVAVVLESVREGIETPADVPDDAPLLDWLHALARRQLSGPMLPTIRRLQALAHEHPTLEPYVLEAHRRIRLVALEVVSARAARSTRPSTSTSWSVRSTARWPRCSRGPSPSDPRRAAHPWLAQRRHLPQDHLHPPAHRLLTGDHLERQPARTQKAAPTCPRSSTGWAGSATPSPGCSSAPGPSSSASCSVRSASTREDLDERDHRGHPVEAGARHPRQAAAGGVGLAGGIVFTAPEGERLDTPQRQAALAKAAADVYGLDLV